MNWTNRAIQLKDEGRTYQEIADILTDELKTTFTYGKVRGWLRRNYKPTPSSGEYSNGAYTFEKIIELVAGEEVTPDMMIKAHGLKVGLWEVLAYRNNFWQAQQKGGGTMLLYQSRITVKPKANGIDVESLTESLKTFEPKTYPAIKYDPGTQMAEVNIADLHLGKLCWHGDTGENYDYKIARENFQNIISDVCARLQGKKLDYILFVWCNDYFNSDTIDKKTTHDTPQDTDVRWQKLYQVGCQMLIEAIDSLMKIAPVKTMYTPSNHDEMNGYYALLHLIAWYRNCPNITIENDAYPRKYVKYGVNLIGFTHGQTEKGKGSKDKASRLASLMPLEAAKLWGDTTRREIHAAHLHSEQMIEEINGVLVRRVSSPTASDTYHVTSGYVGAQQKAMTFIWDKELGNTEIINSFV